MKIASPLAVGWRKRRAFCGVRMAFADTANGAASRRALYMPALVAVRFDAHLPAFYPRLLDHGKPKMQALAAVMRKLLHAIFGMFKHHPAYDGSKVFLPPPRADSNSTSGAAA